MKVVHVIPSLDAADGGPTAALRLMERALSARGISLTTFATVGAAPPEPATPGVPRIYAGRWTRFYKFAPGLVIPLWRQLAACDVLHVHALFSFASLAAALLARLRGVPYVVRPLGTLSAYGFTARRPWLKALSFRLLEGPALRNAAAVHVTSAAERDEVMATGIACRCAVIPLGIDLGKPTPHASGRHVLFLSRLDPKKNVEGLLEAMRLLRAALPDVTLTIAGSGSSGYEAALKDRARQLGLADIRWLGHITGEAKAAALAEASLFVLPSFSENFGIAAAEALAAGVPCVLGQGVAIARQVEEARAGVAVAPEPMAIAEALRNLLEEPDRLSRMRVHARQLAESEFSSEVMAERLEALYAGLLRTGSRP